MSQSVCEIRDIGSALYHLKDWIRKNPHLKVVSFSIDPTGGGMGAIPDKNLIILYEEK